MHSSDTLHKAPRTFAGSRAALCLHASECASVKPLAVRACRAQRACPHAPAQQGAGASCCSRAGQYHHPGVLVRSRACRARRASEFRCTPQASLRAAGPAAAGGALGDPHLVCVVRRTRGCSASWGRRPRATTGPSRPSSSPCCRGCKRARPSRCSVRPSCGAAACAARARAAAPAASRAVCRCKTCAHRAVLVECASRSTVLGCCVLCQA